MSEQQAIELQQRSWQLQTDGRLDEAAQAAREALRLIEESAGSQSPDVANLLIDLADIEHQRGDYSAALFNAERARCIEDILGPQFVGEDCGRIRLRTLAIIGATCRTLGEYARAELHLGAALAIARSQFGEESEEVAVAQNDLAVLYKYWGRFDDAERLYRLALASLIVLHGEDGLPCAGLYHNIGGLLHARGAFALAELPARRAWEISQRHWGEDHVRTALDAVAYAAVLEGLKRYEECERIYRAALPIFEQTFGERHVESAALLHNLAAVVESRADAEQAELLYRRALAMREALLGDSHPDVALTSSNLGQLLARRGQTVEARRLLERAVVILQRSGPTHPHLATVAAHLAAIVS
jgi:tetratricopeptide (TPR) repeat protein